MNQRVAAPAALLLIGAVLSACAEAAPTCDQQTAISFTATPAVITAGASAALLATFSSGAGVVSPGVGAVQSGAAVSVQPAATTSYRLVVTDGSCTSTRTAGVTVVPPAQVFVSIAPTSATVAQGGALAFSATVVGPPDLSVRWSVQESNGGAIDPQGNYTAPTHPGTFHVVAASAVAPSSTATATVQVTDASVAVSPSSADLLQGATQTFQATVTGAVDTAVTWSVLESNGGTIDSASGAYRAPSRAGTFHVVAQSHAEPSVTASATVTVPDVSISLSPTTANVVVLGTQLFSATVTGTVDQAVLWSVESGGGSAVAGLYTAPTSTGLYHVVATAHGDQTKHASAAVTVVAVNVTISSPAVPLTLGPGATQLFAAIVQGTSDQSIDWSVLEQSGGSIDTNGVYTAPILDGTYHVIAASHAVPSASASAAVTVQGGLPLVPQLTNVVAQVHGDTVRVTFDPVDHAADYRIYLAPAAADIVAQGDGGTSIHNGTYRCAGAREAPNVATDTGGSDWIYTEVTAQVLGYGRTAANAILGYVYTAPGAGLSPVWAMGDPSHDADNACFDKRWTESRAKKYTASASEHTSLLAAGWRDDGIVFYAPGAGAGTVVVDTALTTDAAPARLYFADSAEKSARSSLGPTAAFSVLSAKAAGTQPLYRVFYLNQCGRSHDELVVGLARFQRAVNQGLAPIPLVNWAGLGGPSTLIVEALDQGCPFQGHLSPQSVDAGTASGGSPHQAFFTLQQLRAADPMGEVFVGGEYDAGAGVRPNALARAVVQVAPAPLEPMDFSDDFAPDGGTLLPLTPTGSPGFKSVRFDSPAYDVELYTLDLPFYGIGLMLGELWVTYADWASDTNGKFRLTVKQQAALSDTTFLHVMDEVDIVTSGRRYPQILVSTVPIPVQDNLTSGTTLVLQTFGQWSPNVPAVQFELCDHRTWDVNNQCPLFYSDPLSENPFGGDPLPPHAEIGDLGGVDRRVRFDLYLSTARAYAFVEGRPWACANLPAAVAGGGAAAPDAGSPAGFLAGPVSVTFGDVLYHSGVDVPDPPYTFHRAHLYTETRRHFDALGFKSGVPAPAWDEAALPCTSTFVH